MFGDVSRKFEKFKKIEGQFEEITFSIHNFLRNFFVFHQFFSNFPHFLQNLLEVSNQEQNLFKILKFYNFSHPGIVFGGHRMSWKKKSNSNEFKEK